MASKATRSKQQTPEGTPGVAAEAGAPAGLKRLFLLGSIAIAAFFATVGALIYRATEYEPSRSPAPTPVVEIAGIAGAEAGAPAGVAEGAGAPEGSPRAVRSIPPGATAGPFAVEQRFAPARRAALRLARKELIAGFQGLRERAAGCGAQEASFLLALESDQGFTRVNGVRVDFKGAASDAAVACVESTLSGQTFASPAVQPGRRWEAPFTVPPKS